MQTYSVEAATADFASLLKIAARGEEVLITERDKPVAKLIPSTDPESYRERVRALRGFLKGIDTTIDRGEKDRV